MAGPTILIVEDEIPQLRLLAKRCGDAGFEKIVECLRPQDAKAEWVANNGFDAVLLDLALAEGDPSVGFSLLKWMREHSSTPKRVFVRSAYLERNTLALEAVALHRFTFYEKAKTEHEQQLTEDLEEFVTEHARKWDKHIYYESASDKHLLAQIPHIASSNLAVLIIGPTGTGKSVLAQQIVEKSGCLPITRINCAAIAPNLFESEVFGHRKGSFTGALADKLGKLMEASGYTAFVGNKRTSYKNGVAFKSPNYMPGAVILDEVATLSLENQAKLLTVFDGDPIIPVGHTGEGFLPNFRVVAATNEESKLLEPSQFRPDLKERLQGIVIRLGPAHQRLDTAKTIIDQVRVCFRNDEGDMVASRLKMSSDAKAHLLENLERVKGGFRELHNVISRAHLYARMANRTSVEREHIRTALDQSFHVSERAPTSATPTAAPGADSDSEREAASEIANWLKERGISADVLNYKTLVTVIPLAQYREFLDFVSKKFTGSLKNQAGFLAVMSKGLSKQVPANTVRAAFTNRLKNGPGGGEK